MCAKSLGAKERRPPCARPSRIARLSPETPARARPAPSGSDLAAAVVDERRSVAMCPHVVRGVQGAAEPRRADHHGRRPTMLVSS